MMQRRFSELRRVFEKKAPPITTAIETPTPPKPEIIETPAFTEPQEHEIVQTSQPEELQVVIESNIINDKDQVFLNTLPILAAPHVVTADLAMSTLAVISLNLLADCNLTNSLKNDGDYRYKHARNEAPWSVRLPKLHTLLARHISQGQVDVFCFQEADYYLFQSDIKPFLLEFGFVSHHQWDDEVIKKKKQPSNPFGVAISYRQSKFKETFRESRSRTMMIGLSEVVVAAETTSGKRMSDWFVVNCHLEADSHKNDKRMAQLSSTLFNLSVHGKINPRVAKVVVTGDFNSLATEQPFQWLLGETNVENIQPHAFRFRDAYESADESTRNTATYADPHAREHVDHVAFTADTCEVLQWLPVPLLTENTTQYGIFYDDYPSDHYPVGCLVRALPVTMVVVDNMTEEKEDDSLTPGQMRVLEFLERGAPKRAKGKPTPAEVSALKAHTASMQAFSSHLNKSQKAWVAKWRKAYKPAEEENAQKRTTRSMSLVFSQQKQQVEEMFVGVGELFEEEGNAQQQAATSMPPKPVAPKRRQTLFIRTKPMF